jgi:hypothetical protein
MDKGFNLPADIPCGTGDFPPPNGRHNAIGAKIIAPIHDSNKRRKVFGTPGGIDLRYTLIDTGNERLLPLFFNDFIY